MASGKALCGAAVPAASALTFFSKRSDCLVTCGRYSLLVWQVPILPLMQLVETEPPQVPSAAQPLLYWILCHIQQAQHGVSVKLSKVPAEDEAQLLRTGAWRRVAPAEPPNVCQ